jgi:tetratricopeptide (TPR) repeat protein
MRRRSTKLFLVLAALLPPLLAPAAKPAADARDEWLGVRSRNFLVVGEAGERELRRVAVRLEEYRAAFSRLMSDEHFDAAVPTAVVVFRDERAYEPFKPAYRGQTASSVVGYFQPGAEVNYITLALDADAARGGGSSTLLHEYTHLLVNNYFQGAPLWLKEGLAEFYSTARVSGDRRRLTLGAPIPVRVRELRARALLPLATLFEVDQQSPYYFEADKRGLFYAESWALVHYLLNGGTRRAQLARFIELLASGETVREGFREAFRTDTDELERELAAYVRLAAYPESTEAFDRPLDFDSQLQLRPMTNAEGLARLGDLLLHTGRAADAEGYLRRALELDTGLAAARVSLGALRLKQGRPAEAREELQRAAALDPQNYLAHYHLADALNREGDPEGSDKISVQDFERRTDTIRAELRKAIELAPGFLESYRLLAAVELERGDRPEEAASLLRRASALAPRRLDFVLLLAQAHLFKGEFEEARRLAEPVARRGGDARLREQAALLLGRINAREELAVRLKSQRDEAARLEASEAAPTQPCDMPERGGPQYKRLRFAGEQACGRLVEIACDDGGGVTLRVEAGGRTLQLRAADLRDVRFVTYTAAVKTGRLTCGVREPANPVLVTYRPKHDARQGSDGEALAVEFIPEDWNH